MKTDALELTLLFDTYGELLTDKQRLCFDLYYNQDLSLGEIAQEVGVSRQGVYDSIARAEAALRAMEARVGALRRDRLSQSALERIQAAARTLAASNDAAVRSLAQEILAAADTIKE